jgi:hypothetical protein
MPDVDAAVFDSLAVAVEFVAARGGGCVYTEAYGTPGVYHLELPPGVWLAPPRPPDAPVRCAPLRYGCPDGDDRVPVAHDYATLVRLVDSGARRVAVSGTIHLPDGASLRLHRGVDYVFTPGETVVIKTGGEA